MVSPPIFTVAKQLRKSMCFQFTLLVVALNAAWMAIDMDLNTATIITSAHPVFIIVENVPHMLESHSVIASGLQRHLEVT